ncbi:hypothetical protein LRS74_23050 [Streptomyces sp. LX-29]|uniref:hypothetical protein n=1 Tax=Streptomyces sp. LX-29 TaxID=2900152 RepID=UPI00240D950A|nr:hypothetical protein [Streptomyces sp. LX-29]WFB09600.1 hypothetical protein LRS74_23050 [Streptomyces sp. LX-29]
MHHAIAWIFELVLRRLLRIPGRRVETSLRSPATGIPGAPTLQLRRPWWFLAAADVAFVWSRGLQGVA